MGRPQAGLSRAEVQRRLSTCCCSSRADPELVKEVERRLRVSDMVMKFITVRIDEKLKKIEKRKKAREKRAARRPAPQVAAPAAAVPAAAAPAMPGAPSRPGTDAGQRLHPARLPQRPAAAEATEE